MRQAIVMNVPLLVIPVFRSIQSHPCVNTDSQTGVGVLQKTLCKFLRVLSKDKRRLELPHIALHRVRFCACRIAYSRMFAEAVASLLDITQVDCVEFAKCCSWVTAWLYSNNYVIVACRPVCCVD